MGISQNLKGNKYQIRKVDQSNKQKKTESDHPSLRKKTINRGNSVENIQITHIILTSKPLDFHIIENLIDFIQILLMLNYYLKIIHYVTYSKML